MKRCLSCSKASVLAFLVAVVIMAEVPGSSAEKSAGLEELITVVTSLKEQVQRQQEAQVSLTQQLAVLQQQQTTSVPGSRGCGDNGSFPPTQPTGRLRSRIMWFRCFVLSVSLYGFFLLVVHALLAAYAANSLSLLAFVGLISCVVLVWPSHLVCIVSVALKLTLLSCVLVQQVFVTILLALLVCRCSMLILILLSLYRGSTSLSLYCWFVGVQVQYVKSHTAGLLACTRSM